MNAHIDAIKAALTKAGKAGEALNRERADAARTRNRVGMDEFLKDYRARMRTTTDAARAEIRKHSDELKAEINTKAAFNFDRVNPAGLAFLQTHPDGDELQSMAHYFSESPEMIRAIKREAESRHIEILTPDKSAAADLISRNALQIIDGMTHPDEARAATYAGYAADAETIFSGDPIKSAVETIGE